MMKSSFPESKLKSKFGMLGVSLSKEEFAERTQRLDQWLSEVFWVIMSHGTWGLVSSLISVKSVFV